MPGGHRDAAWRRSGSRTAAGSTLDFAAGDAVVCPGYGGAQGIFFVMSDLLGDNLLYGSVSSYQGRRSRQHLFEPECHRDLPEPVAAGELGHRRVPDQEPELRGRPRRRVRARPPTASLGVLRYPLTRFTRVEGTIVIEHSDRSDFTLPVDEPRRIGLDRVALPELRSRQLPLDPERADRWRPLSSLTAGVSSDFTNSRLRQLSGRPATGGTTSGWGGRAPGRSVPTASTAAATGRGGSTSVAPSVFADIPEFGYIVGSRAFMFNQEVRFPILTHLTLGTPFGDLDLPEIQGGAFTDVGQARRSPPPPTVALLGQLRRLVSAWRWVR